MTAPLKLAVFDCDGTLVDSQHSIIAAMSAAAQAESLPAPSHDAIRRVVGLPLIDAILRLFEGVDETRAEALQDTYREAFFQQRDTGDFQEPLYPGILDCLDALEDAGWLLAVATGKSYRGLVGTLEHHNILHRFVSLQTADRAHGKPHPDMMLKAMAQSGVEAQNAVMIGDTTYDVEMSVNAGTRAIGVSWGYHGRDELLAAGAVGVVDTGRELIDLILSEKSE